MLLVMFLLSAISPRAADQYRVAVPGYHYEFPRDHFNHPEFRTEWWYYTGNLTSRDRRRFGFELTFFRQATAPDDTRNPDQRPSGRGLSDQGATPSASDRDSNSTGSQWQVHDIYLAHLALSDIEAKKYLHTSRINRPGPGLAGADLTQSRIWNGNWKVQWSGDTQRLQAVTERFTLNLDLKSVKPPVINGVDGVAQKAPARGRASYYISLTRLLANGTLVLNGTRYELNGLAWMDHEFLTSQFSQSQIGWNWLSLQLDDGSDYMLYTLRRNDGKPDPYSAGTYVDQEGHAQHLDAREFSLERGQATWTSPSSGATYPVEWRVRVEPTHTILNITTPLENQEFTGSGRLAPTYWEGAIRVEGNASSARVAGAGYLEMTGYDRPVDLSQ
jgi:predicted secreted hydrolase